MSDKNKSSKPQGSTPPKAPAPKVVTNKQPPADRSKNVLNARDTTPAPPRPKPGK